MSEREEIILMTPETNGHFAAAFQELADLFDSGASGDALIDWMRLHYPPAADRMCREGYARLLQTQARQPWRQGASHRQREPWPIHGTKNPATGL